MSEETVQLKQRLADIDGLVKDNTISEERGAAWKERVIAEFEATKIPGAPTQSSTEESKDIMETTDLGHLPGRMIGKSIPLLKGFLQGCGATYKGLSEQEGYDITLPGQEKKDASPRNRPKSPQEIYDDLPDHYK
jgi:hypothetical protein